MGNPRKRSAAVATKDRVVVEKTATVEAVVAPVTEATKNLEIVGETVVSATQTETAPLAANVEKSPVLVAPEVAKLETAKAPKAPKAPVVEVAVVEEAAEKMYDCLGLKDHQCRIGGEIVIVAKDKYQTFPSTIAMVLQTARVVIVK